MNFIVNYYQGNFKLLLIASDEDERNFLESHIGEIIELQTAVQQSSPTDETLGCPSCSLGSCPDGIGGFIPCTICGNTAQHKSLCDCGQLFPDNGYCVFCGVKK